MTPLFLDPAGLRQGAATIRKELPSGSLTRNCVGTPASGAPLHHTTSP